MPPWKKGQSGNPSGRPKLPKDLQKIPEITPAEFRRVLSKYFRMTPEQVLKLMESPENLSCHHLAVINCVMKAVGGDMERLRFITERLVGKPKDETHYEEMTPEEQEAAGKPVLEYMEPGECAAMAKILQVAEQRKAVAES